MAGSQRLTRLAIMLAATATVSIGENSIHEQHHMLHSNPAQGQSSAEVEGLLTLQRALELTTRLNSELAASKQDVLASVGLVRQSGARPNPELELEIEDFGGTDSLQGFDAATTTALISQPIELGAKRKRRQKVAQAEARLVEWDYRETYRAAHAKTKRDFVAVLAAQKKVALTGDALALAEDVLMTVESRVKAGKVPELECTKATVEVSFASIEHDSAKRDLDVSRKLLAANWGSRTPRFLNAAGSLEPIQDLGTAEALDAMLDVAPAVARWTDELAVSRGVLALAKAERTPDITLSAGFSRSEADGSFSLIAGLSLPLPIFDRQAGSIEAAYHNALGIEHKQRLARLDAETALGNILSRIETARIETVAIRDALLPAAQQAFEAAEAGYLEGKFDFIDVIDAQRTLNEARSRKLDSATALQQALIDLECLTGTQLVTFHE